MSDLAGGHCKNLSLTSVTAYASHPHLPYGKTLLVGRVLGCAERSSTHLAARLYTLASALRCHIVQPVVSASTWRCLTILPLWALPKPNTMSPPAALRRVVGVVMAVAWLFAAPTLCSPAEVEEVACLEDFKLGARADAGRCARDCTSTSNRSSVFCLPRYDVAQCIRSCGAVPSRFPSLSPTQRLQQDWFLKWLYGGPAHSLTACGVATLSP
jgi:hypothetical protein